MAKKRRSRASGAIAVPAPPTESESVRITKISNGYLIEKSGTKNGKYFSHQEYSPGRPVIAASIPKKVTAARPGTARRSQNHKAAPREVGFLRGQ